MSIATRRQSRFDSRFSVIWCFVCALTLFPASLSANNLKICKKTVPSVGSSGPSFNFTGANSWPASSGKDFTTAYVPSQLPSNPFQMKDGDCKTLTLTGHDQFNKITENSPLPPGWTLTNISCSFSKSVVNIIGGNPNPGFQPGDDTVTIDQTDPNVTCTFINTCSFKQENLSTGVGAWVVTPPNGPSTAPHTVPPNSNWASHSPPTSGGPPFPTGTSWVQPANSGTLTPEPPGVYVYKIRFSNPCPATVKGWFAADNQATLVVDSGPPFQCMGNTNFDCFKQANVTGFSQAVPIGTHVITVTVTNQGTTLTGLLANITVQ